jgi:ATP-dependent DNA ligase
MAFVAFDLLQHDGREVMGEPWVDRRTRLEDLRGPPGAAERDHRAREPHHSLQQVDLEVEVRPPLALPSEVIRAD